MAGTIQITLRPGAGLGGGYLCDIVKPDPNDPGVGVAVTVGQVKHRGEPLKPGESTNLTVLDQGLGLEGAQSTAWAVARGLGEHDDEIEFLSRAEAIDSVGK